MRPVTLVRRAPYGNDLSKPPGPKGLVALGGACAICRKELGQGSRTYRMAWRERVYAHADCVDESRHWLNALLVARTIRRGEAAWEWENEDTRNAHHRRASEGMQAVAELGRPDLLIARRDGAEVLARKLWDPSQDLKWNSEIPERWDGAAISEQRHCREIAGRLLTALSRLSDVLDRGAYTHRTGLEHLLGIPGPRDARSMATAAGLLARPYR